MAKKNKFKENLKKYFCSIDIVKKSSKIYKSIKFREIYYAHRNFLFNITIYHLPYSI